MGEFFGAECIQAYIKAVKPRFFEWFGEFVQEESVSGTRQVSDILVFSDFLDEDGEIPSQQGFSPGEPYLFDAEVCSDMDYAYDFFEGKEFFFRSDRIAFFRHAIDASEVTPVGHANSEVVNRSSETIFHNEHSLCFLFG